MLKFFSKSILRIFGWKVKFELPQESKYVVITAPHTSNLDLLMGKLGSWATGLRTKIMIKKEAFVFLLAPLLRQWGGIPIDRENTSTIVEQVVKQFEESEEMALVIAPEGTRKKNANWKTGFYRIAKQANVPIYLGYVDFKTRTVGIHDKFVITGNMEDDIQKIKEYYKDMRGFNRHQFEI